MLLLRIVRADVNEYGFRDDNGNVFAVVDVVFEEDEGEEDKEEEEGGDGDDSNCD